MRKLLILTIILQFLSCNQNTLESDISRIAQYHEKAKNNVNDSTLAYIEKAKDILIKNKKLPDTLFIENIFRRGFYHKQTNNLDSASYYFHRTIDRIEAPNDRKRNLIYFRSTWETDEKLGNYTNGISAAQKYINISNNNGNHNNLVYAYNFLERAYLDLGDLEESLSYNAKAIEAALKAGNMDMYIVSANSKAQSLHENGKKKKAYIFLDSLLSINKNIEVKRQIHTTYGVLKYLDQEYERAIINYDKALSLTKEIATESNYYLLEGYNNIAEAYLELNNYPLSKKYLDSSKATINSESYEDYVSFYEELRFRYNYRTSDDEDKILEEFESLKAKNNQLYQKRIEEELTALKLSYQKEQRTLSEKNKLEVRNLRLFILIGFLALIILVGLLIYRQRKFVFERENLQMQQRLLRSQMNPHFIFNTLSVIQNQIHHNKESAANYLMKFSRLLRLILENSLNDYVQIEDELESLRKYLDLQLVRFPEKFSYSIKTHNFEEDEPLFIPPMLIQPFVENSIEHGFSGINYNGHINIKLSLQDKWVLCNIEDNGIGFNDSNSKLKKSVSVNLISKFIQKTTKQPISITDKKGIEKDETGIKVRFFMPYKFSEHD